MTNYDQMWFICTKSLILFYIHFSIIHIRTNMIPFKSFKRNQNQWTKRYRKMKSRSFNSKILGTWMPFSPCNKSPIIKRIIQLYYHVSINELKATFFCLANFFILLWQGIDKWKKKVIIFPWVNLVCNV